jgi:hypothetical protein
MVDAYRKLRDWVKTTQGYGMDKHDFSFERSHHQNASSSSSITSTYSPLS